MKPDDVGAYAGWGSADDVNSSPRAGAQAPTTGSRFILAKYYRGPGNALMLLYLPAASIALYLELRLGLPPVAAWLSMIGVAIAFVVAAVLINRSRHA